MIQVAIFRKFMKSFMEWMLVIIHVQLNQCEWFVEIHWIHQPAEAITHGWSASYPNWAYDLDWVCVKIG
jgi:hypothetical protein